MIVPMYKYSFVVYHREYPEFLKSIEKLGVVDVSINRNDIDDVVRNKMLINAHLGELIKSLKNRKIEPVEANEIKDGAVVFAEVKEIQAKIEKLSQQTNILRKEIALAAPWGDYSTELISKLHDQGYTIRFFITPERSFSDELSEKENVVVVNRFQTQVYFVVVQKDDEEVDIDADEIKIPAYSPAQLKNILNQTEIDISDANKQLDDYAAKHISALEKSRSKLLHEVGYQQVLLKTVHEADNKLCILTGYVPVTDNAGLDNYLAASDIIHYREKSVPDDKPPILLKNGKFARLFEPIGGIFSMPRYGEMDLTPFFAPFFMMFFGFCMGDFAYGVIFVLAGFLLRNRVSKSLKPYLTLAIFLGIGTMIFGVVSGTILGFSMRDIDFLKPMHFMVLSQMNMFYLALGIGFVQVIFGMCIQAYQRAAQFGFIYSLSTIGVIMAALGTLDLFLLKIGAGYSVYLIYAGLFLMLFMSDPKANIFARFGIGLWNLYGAITGIFGDVLSYIRLFALGASGGILGFVINSISLPILHSVPVLGPILFVIIMIVGHFANIAISGLGAFVHPMRLTFVEFYKNAGFEGGGKEYNPFSKQ